MWKWISEKLEEMGLLELSEKAREIDSILTNMYGTSDTEKFIEDLESIENAYNNRRELSLRLLLIMSICNDEEYTIACVRNPVDYYVTDEYCKQCELAMKYGECGEGNILDKFSDAISKIHRCLDH